MPAPSRELDPRVTSAVITSSRSLVIAVLATIATFVLLCAGCDSLARPPLGLVEGTVTLDGAPLPAALVVFTPTGPGRSATAQTDTAGRYSLRYLRDIPGANVGSHSVRITTGTGKRGVKETLPARYHRRTELRAEVQAGSNAIDFALQSK